MRARGWVLLAGIAAGMAACGGNAPQGPGAGGRPPPEVTVQAVQPTRVERSERLVARLRAVRSAEVRARVEGILQRRLYQEGSDVAAGDVLFEIDPAPLKAEVAAREAAAARAQAEASNAAARAKRTRELAAQKLVAAQALDDALAAERSAQAALREAQAALDKARLDLSYAKVSAPIAGRAGQAEVTEGALVGEDGATLLTRIEQIDTLYADFEASVAELATVQRLQQAQVQPEARVLLGDGSVYPHAGVVDFSDLRVDPRTGLIALRATIPNPERLLLPGMFINLEVSIGAADGVILLPQAAVLRDAQGAYALVLDGEGLVQRRDLTLDGMQGGDYIVRAGLGAGEQVIVAGLQKVRPGSPAKAAAG